VRRADRLTTCLGPRHMPLETERRRHVTVAIPILAVGGLVAVSAGPQCTQPQEPDFTDDRTVAGHGCQPGDRGFGFSHVGVSAAIEQCLRENTFRWNAPPRRLSLPEEMVDGGKHQRYRLIKISKPRPLARQVHLDDR
jgi:hypothetical protein